MKKFLICVFLVLITVMAFGQERIAVFPIEDLDNILSRNESTFFYRQFSNEFTNRNAGRFTVVPRQDVERLINTEMAFQLGEFSASEKTAEMNRVLNGTQILSGAIGRIGSRISISISLYTYPELVQLPGGVDLRVTNKDELFDKIPELVQSIQNIIVASMPPAPAYRIGDRGPGGGVIFFAENGVFMECSMDLGNFTYDEAARAANNHRGGSFNNWRIPTSNELRLIYTNLRLNGLGGLSGNYWFDNGNRTRVYWLNFSDGTQGSELKNRNPRRNVRAVRSFTQ
ncbi:MAG: DUF1566 domain-containing protein [Treponema sp.]|nr:DUF1566 domain-containing protein [Treponema sp.]